ncbi:hypothetical protein ACTXLD_01490 [Psychrobacter faecalis]
MLVSFTGVPVEPPVPGCIPVSGFGAIESTVSPSPLPQPAKANAQVKKVSWNNLEVRGSELYDFFELRGECNVFE